MPRPAVALRPNSRPTAAHEVDQALLDATVAQLNQTYIRQGLDTAQRLVKVLVDAFWQGSLARALRSRDRHATFLALRSRDDLQVAYPTLIRMLRVVALVDRLEASGTTSRAEGRELSYSHVAELLRLKDDTLAPGLAATALSARWSVRALRLAVDEANGVVVQQVSPLRHLHKGLLQSTNAVHRALGHVETLSGHPDQQAEAAEVMLQLDALMAACKELRGELADRWTAD